MTRRDKMEQVIVGPVCLGEGDSFRYHVEQPAHAKALAMVGAGKKVLEIGCAAGFVTRLMKENLRCTVTAIEIDNVAAQNAAAYCERVIVGDADYLDYGQLFPVEKFDVILLGDIIEHLKYPARVLSAVRDLSLKVVTL